MLTSVAERYLYAGPEVDLMKRDVGLGRGLHSARNNYKDG